ncbi:hypothetical protein OF83DRAFT_1152851 [Amylostereum chailletii]|nr:hypothetical protein OF83DRAFT_1152851 [Amylostereum chailletii]
MASPRTRRWGPLTALLVLSPLFLVAPWLTYKHHYALPTPITDLVDPTTNLPQLSESQILAYTKHLSEDIGYRTVGTYEHALADKWLHEKVEAMRRECEEVVRGTGRKLECEVWRQEGTGSHRFDMMGKRLYKHYVNLSNIIVRVSDGTPEGKQDAVLVNAHLDSTLPSPGAADDALSVGVMLECIRVLTHTPDWTPKHAIIFLFNHAEESLQDGSQLYSTQHPTASTVRAFINLEAAGTTGPELLFQATSEEMIEAYSKVPHPFGTVLANEVFSSGVLLSDTDFRQFELYLNITGLDMAVVTNSYMYHTRKDVVENIEPGVAQHMAENTLAILKHLTSEGSPLPSLTTGHKRPTTVFFSHLGYFFMYSFATAKAMYATLTVVAVAFVAATYRDPTLALGKGQPTVDVWRAQLRGVRAIVLAFVGALVAANAHAVIMHRVMGKNMSWFSSELSALVLYAPAALSGAFASQLLISPVHERTMFTALVLLLSGSALGVQMMGIGSAVMFFMAGLPLFVTLVVDRMINSSATSVSLAAYALGQIVPLVTGTQIICSVLDVFVPLTGRFGRDAPAEHIIATIVAITCAYTFPLVAPFAHRYGSQMLLYSVVGLNVVMYISAMIFASRSPFDAMHQRRLFVLSSDNITSRERYLHIGAADGAPGFEELVHDIAAQVGVAGTYAVQEEMDDWNGDWDVLYPFSAFMSPYKIPLPIDAGYVSPHAAGGEHEFTVQAVNDRVDTAAGTRSLTLKIVHPGVIWTVIAFDAHVLKWTLDDAPPDEHTRHHIKEASFYGTDVWSVDLVVKLPAEGKGKLKVNFVGVQENAMWPGKMRVKAEGGPSMALFEKLDGWVTERTGGEVDPMLLGSVGGVVVV